MLEVFHFRSARTSYNDQHIIIRILPLKGVSRQGMSLQVFLSRVYRSRIDLADLSSPVWSCFFYFILLHFWGSSRSLRQCSCGSAGSSTLLDKTCDRDNVSSLFIFLCSEYSYLFMFYLHIDKTFAQECSFSVHISLLKIFIFFHFFSSYRQNMRPR